MQPDIQRKVDDLLPYIKQIANGRVAVALFGAHAKGVDDAAVLDQQYTLLKTVYADIRKRVSGLSA